MERTTPARLVRQAPRVRISRQPAPDDGIEQEVHCVTSRDGVRIACPCSGDGQAAMKIDMWQPREAPRYVRGPFRHRQDG
jgi:hypothetical protein